MKEAEAAEATRRKKIIVAIAVAAGQNLLKSNVEHLLTQDSSDEELDHWSQITKALETGIRVRGEPNKVTRISGYVSTIVRDYSSQQFKEHFRLSRTTFENLERILTPQLMRTAESGRFTTDVRIQLLAVLWLLATPDSFRSVSDRFGISKSVLHASMRRVVTALNELADRFIKWPVDNELIEVERRFLDAGPFQGVIGAIDGSHIPIPAPKVDSIFYRTRKKEYALTLQAVCVANLVFTDCFVGFAGSVHDARIFRNSDLWHRVTTNHDAFFPGNQFIIGDKAYPVTQWCMAPYTNRGNLTEAQKNFNNHLSKMRQVIERAFALLKGRFRRLKYLHMSCADLIPHVILACCVLHNICLVSCDDDINDFLLEGIEQRDENHNDRNEMDFNRVPDDETGLARRNYLAAQVAHIAP
ncbi:putative nuclease HARBI1 [Venturia canescens]|uniref:putative nuclease HARBI1 n=1 Tax=Venturia canescens TaxID=32260 RepID=UPI001C9C7A87|nr:putative nuclease HARBI1 [Venturia canescens]